MHAHELALWKVYPAGNGMVVHVPNGIGESLRAFLHSRGVSSLVSPAAATSYERLEIADRGDLAEAQALVDAWRKPGGESEGGPRDASSTQGP